LIKKQNYFLRKDVALQRLYFFKKNKENNYPHRQKYYSQK